MKRFALAAAAALLGTGCIVVDDDPTPPPCSTTLTVDWAFQRYDGGAPVGCTTAGVDWVDVYVDGNFWDSRACTSGGATIPVVAGSHDLVVEGIDPALRIAYRDTVTTSVASCANRSVSVTPAEGLANLNYSLTTALPSTCNASPCYLWFSVWDLVADVPAAAVYAESLPSVKDDYPYPNDVIVRLAAGSYSLDWMELMSSGYGGLLLTCNATTFDVASTLQTNVPAPLSCLPP